MIKDTRDLYLDLLVKTLSNLIYGPAPADPWNDGLFRSDAPPGRDRNSPAHTMVGILRLQNVRELAQRALELGIHGNFIETGVWRGGCSILMRGVLAANGVADRRVFVADSFAGLPPGPLSRRETISPAPISAASFSTAGRQFDKKPSHQITPREGPGRRRSAYNTCLGPNRCECLGTIESLV